VNVGEMAEEGRIFRVMRDDVYLRCKWCVGISYFLGALPSLCRKTEKSFALSSFGVFL